MLTQNSTKLSTIVSIQSETFSDWKVFISLREFTNFATSKDLILSCLEVGLHNKSSIVNQSIFVNYIENFGINIDKARCYKEGWLSNNLIPLFLLIHLNFLFRRRLFLAILRIILILILDFIAHFLRPKDNFSPFLLDEFLELIIVTGLLPELDAPARIAIDFIEFIAVLDRNAHGSQHTVDLLFDRGILESVRVIDQTSLVLNSLLIALEAGCPPPSTAGHNVMDTFRLYPSRNEPTYESNCVWSATVNCYALGLFLTL